MKCSRKKNGHSSWLLDTYLMTESLLKLFASPPPIMVMYSSEFINWNLLRLINNVVCKNSARWFSSVNTHFNFTNWQFYMKFRIYMNTCAMIQSLNAGYLLCHSYSPEPRLLINKKWKTNFTAKIIKICN